MVTTPGTTRALLPLLLPPTPQGRDNDNDYQPLLLGSISLPGVSPRETGRSTNNETEAGDGACCFLYRASGSDGSGNGEWDADAAVVCACDAEEVPVEVRFKRFLDDEFIIFFWGGRGLWLGGEGLLVNIYECSKKTKGAQGRGVESFINVHTQTPPPHRPHRRPHTPKPTQPQSQHALASLLLQRLRPTQQTLILDLLKDGGRDPGDELAPHALHGLLEEEEEEDGDEGDASPPFLVRSLRTLGAKAEEVVVKGMRPLEEGVAVTGVGAAVLARCQLLSLPATALVLAVPPSPAGGAAPLRAFERRLAAVVAGVRGAVGLGLGLRLGGEGGGNAGEGLLRAAAKALRREGQGRLAEGGGMLYL